MWEPWNLPLWMAWMLLLAAGVAVGSLLAYLVAWLPWRMQCEWAWHAQQWQAAAGAPAAGPPAAGSPAAEASAVGSSVADTSQADPVPAAADLPPLQRVTRPVALAVVAAAVALAAACGWRFGFNWAMLAALGCCWVLLLLAVIDTRELLLPDVLTLPLLWAGLLVNLAGPVWASLPHAVLGAVAGYLALWLLFHAFRLLTGREGMGHGDFKLLAALGAWLGLGALPQVILIASFSGLAWGVWMVLCRRAHLRTAMPFGLHLAWAGAAVLLWLGPR